jgi:hypothetical protein
MMIAIVTTPAPPPGIHRSAPERPAPPSLPGRAASTAAVLAAASLYRKLDTPREALPPNWLKIAINSQR